MFTVHFYRYHDLGSLKNVPREKKMLFLSTMPDQFILLPLILNSLIQSFICSFNKHLSNTNSHSPLFKWGRREREKKWRNKRTLRKICILVLQTIVKWSDTEIHQKSDLSFFFWVFRPNLEMFRVYFWFYTLGSYLVGFRRPY